MTSEGERSDTLIKLVRIQPTIIMHIDNPDENLQLEAVKNNSSVIQFIENPTELVQLAAVKQDGCAIQFINKPSEKVQLEAIKQNGCAIQFINKTKEETTNTGDDFRKELMKRILKITDANDKKLITDLVIKYEI